MKNKTEQSSKKRAVLISVSVILACLVVLSGVVYAWFSGLSKAPENKITTDAISFNGKLQIYAREDKATTPDDDVLLVDEHNEQQANFINKTGWKPGTTFTRRIVVRNIEATGDDIFYTMTFRPVVVDAEKDYLSEAIVVRVEDMGATGAAVVHDYGDRAFEEASFDGGVSPGQDHVYRVTLTLPENAPEIYKAKKFDFDILLTGTNPDSRVTIHHVSTSAELKALFSAATPAAKRAKDGDTIVLVRDITVDRIESGVLFNMNFYGHSLTVEDLFTIDSSQWGTIDIGAYSKGNLTVTSGKIGINAPNTAIRWGDQPTDSAPSGYTMQTVPDANLNAFRLNGTDKLNDQAALPTAP